MYQPRRLCHTNHVVIILGVQGTDMRAMVSGEIILFHHFLIDIGPSVSHLI